MKPDFCFERIERWLETLESQSAHSPLVYYAPTDEREVRFDELCKMYLDVSNRQRGVIRHEQDTENAARYGDLFLAYGAVEEGEAAQVAVAQRIVDTLRDAGFAVEWNGSVKERVFVTGLDWKKRRDRCR